MSENVLSLFKQINQMEKDIIAMLNVGSLDFKDVPELVITEFICLYALINDIENFSKIPLASLSNIVCLAACQIKTGLALDIPAERSGWVNKRVKDPFLQYLSVEKKLEEICTFFINLDHRNIAYIPDQLKQTRAYLEQVCTIKPKVLSELDKEYIDDGLCLIAIESPSFDLTCLPESLRTKDFCYKAFNKNYRDIMNIPQSLIDYSMVYTAIEKCESGEVEAILELLPPALWDKKIIIKSVVKSESAFYLVPYELITEEIVFELAPYFKRHETLHHVPENIFNENLNNRLISENPLLLHSIPIDQRNRVLCFTAISADGLALAAAPNDTKTDEMYKLAISNNGLALRYVPTPYRDDMLPTLAVKQNGEAIQYVPSDMIDEVLCRTAVMQNAHAIYKVPKHYLTHELYLLAIKSIPHVLKLIPADSRTVEYCVMALKKDHSMYEYIPVHLRKEKMIVELAKEYGVHKEFQP